MMVKYPIVKHFRTILKNLLIKHLKYVEHVIYISLKNIDVFSKKTISLFKIDIQLKIIVSI